jgi:hypothetical protein
LSRFDFSDNIADAGGTALAEAPPKITQHEKIELEIIEMQRFLSIRNLSSHRLVALLEIVSPGNKNNQARYDAFVHKTVDAVRCRVSVLLVDVHETGRFDQNGISACLRIMLSPHSTPIVDKPRHSTLASYCPDPP